MSMSQLAVQGAIFQMLAHGISTGGLFLGVGLLYDRRHTRKLDDFGGLWKKIPVFAALFLVITLASVGLPGLCGFVGEFLILIGTFNADSAWARAGMEGFFVAPRVLTIISASAVILAAMYLLTMYQKIFFGPLDNPANRDPHVRDAHGREIWVFAIVILAALVTGIYPQPILARSEKSVAALIATFEGRLKDAAANPDAPSHLFPATAADRHDGRTAPQ
jgi:NADH-quinone oxidoreductase subunit M